MDHRTSCWSQLWIIDVVGMQSVQLMHLSFIVEKDFEYVQHMDGTSVSIGRMGPQAGSALQTWKKDTQSKWQSTQLHRGLTTSLVGPTSIEEAEVHYLCHEK